MLSSAKGEVTVVSTKAMVRAPKPNIAFGPFIDQRSASAMRRQRQHGADDGQP